MNGKKNWLFPTVKSENRELATLSTPAHYHGHTTPERKWKNKNTKIKDREMRYENEPKKKERCYVFMSSAHLMMVAEVLTAGCSYLMMVAEVLTAGCSLPSIPQDDRIMSDRLFL